MRQSIMGLAILCMGLAATAQARDLKFVTIDVAPWASQSASGGAPTGIFPAVVQELERRTGHRIAISLHPFARLDLDLGSGAQDCTIIVWSEARSPLVERGETLSSHELGVIARKDLPLKTYDDLKSMRVSVLRGAAIDPRFDADNAVVKESDADYTIGLRKIAHRRLDAIAGALTTIRWLAKKEGFDGLLGEELALNDTPLVLQCSKRSANLDVLPQLNNAIRTMREDGTAERITKEYYAK